MARCQPCDDDGDAERQIRKGEDGGDKTGALVGRSEGGYGAIGAQETAAPKPAPASAAPARKAAPDVVSIATIVTTVPATKARHP